MYENTTHATPERFRRFAEVECRESSPFYSALAQQIANDPALLDIAARAPVDQPPPNMLFAGVRYLLLKAAAEGNPPPLAAFYPGGEKATPPGQPVSPLLFPVFRAFCLEHIHTLRVLLQTRRVQTNEVRRAACLLPAFGLVSQQNDGKPLTMVEIGASAGLNLLWDHFGYTYRHAAHDIRTGDAASAVQITSVIEGEARPPIPATLPEVLGRAGIDLYPVDFNDEDALLWLRALIWPEHADREALLVQAVQLARGDAPIVYRGGALELLPQVIATLRDDLPLLIYHSFTLNQFTQVMRDQLNDLLAGMSRYRSVYRVSMEWERRHEGPVLRLLSYRRGMMTAQTLAHCEAHGRWIRWEA